jgi:hypothetical protein
MSARATPLVVARLSRSWSPLVFAAVVVSHFTLSLQQPLAWLHFVYPHLFIYSILLQAITYLSTTLLIA